MRSLIFLITVVVLTGCGGYTEYPGKGDATDPTQDPQVQSVSFSEVMTKVFRPKCVGCHGRSGGVNLESSSAARAHLQEIWNSAVVSNRMPKSPYPSLTADERSLLRAWVKAGGPDEPMNGGPGSPVQPPLQAKFDSIRINIFVPKCLSCHSAGGSAARVPLSTREDLVNSPLEIVLPGNPDESGLILLVTEGARKFMPPPESGIAPVKESEIQVLREWIQRGATD